MQFASRLLSAVMPGAAAAPPAPLSVDDDGGEWAATCVGVLQGHEDRVWSVAWHPGGRLLASCSGDKSVRLWDVTSGRCINTLSEHQRTVRCVAWSPSGAQLACACFDATVTVWARGDEGFSAVDVIDGHENEVKCVAWRDEDTLAACSRDKNVSVWERDAESGAFECAGILGGHMQDVKRVCWLPGDGRPPALLSCGYDDVLKLWEEAAGRKDDWHCTQTLIAHTATVWDIAVQRGGRRVVSCGADGAVVYWECDAGGRWRAAATAGGVGVGRALYSVDARAADDLVAVGGGDDAVALLLGTRVAGRIADAHDADVNCVRFSPDGTHLATAGDDGLVKIWKVEKKAPA